MYSNSTIELLFNPIQLYLRMCLTPNTLQVAGIRAEDELQKVVIVSSVPGLQFFQIGCGCICCILCAMDS